VRSIAELSDDGARRGNRLIRAAELALDLGRQHPGLTFLQTAASLDLAAEEQTRLLCLTEIYNGVDRVAAAKLLPLVDVADRMIVAGHIDLALKMLLTVARAAAGTLRAGPPPRRSSRSPTASRTRKTSRPCLPSSRTPTRSRTGRR
jgi:hypothetical protein